MKLVSEVLVFLDSALEVGLLVSLPGKPHGQRRLAACSPRGHKESDTTDRLTHFPWWLGW